MVLEAGLEANGARCMHAIISSFSQTDSRVKGLIQGGAMKYEERPVWFDVYRAFPPAEEPLYEKPVRTTEVRNIFYPEDAVRA